MTLRKRIERLEVRNGADYEIPMVVHTLFKASRGEDGQIVPEAVSAMFQVSDGWETIAREDGEAEAAFLERIGRKC